MRVGSSNSAKRFCSRNSRRGIASSLVVIVVVVIIIVAAVAGVYYYYYVASPPKPPVQTFTFGLEGSDATHAALIDALNHVSQFNLHANVKVISDPTSLTSAGSNGQLDMFEFQFPTTTINAIESGANLVGIGEDSTAFLQDLVVSSSIQSFSQLNGTTMAAFSLDGPVLFPLVFASYGYNYSKFNINLVVIGDSSVKAQGLIAGKYSGAFLDPQDAATVFKSVPGKFHILGTTALAFPGIGGGVIFANKSWLKNQNNFNMAVDLEVAYLESVRNETQNLPAWIQRTYSANFTSLDPSIYNTTEYILYQSDYFSPNMITFTPSLANASDYFLAGGGLINSSGNVNQIYNFSVLRSALNIVGTVKEPPGPYSTDTPLSLAIPSSNLAANNASIAWLLMVPAFNKKALVNTE